MRNSWKNLGNCSQEILRNRFWRTYHRKFQKISLNLVDIFLSYSEELAKRNSPELVTRNSPNLITRNSLEMWISPNSVDIFARFSSDLVPKISPFQGIWWILGKISRIFRKIMTTVQFYVKVPPSLKYPAPILD